jgi:hypothetical protein
MFRTIAAILGAGLFLLASSARAAAMSPDPTGMWYDASQPGWGMSVTQQGDNIFIALFVYDGSHNPQWFVASNVVDTGTVHSGPLYQTTGPNYAQSSDPTKLVAAAVGTIEIAYVQPNNDLSVTYTVNGTMVTKVVQPQTWASKASLLSDLYLGGFFFYPPMDHTNPLCGPPLGLIANAAPLHVPVFSISQPIAGGMSFAIGLPADADSGFAGSTCVISGTYTQRGQFGTFSGPLICGGPIFDSTATTYGTVTISGITATPYGILGSVTYTDGSCVVPGGISGVRMAQQ